MISRNGRAEKNSTSLLYSEKLKDYKNDKTMSH